MKKFILYITFIITAFWVISCKNDDISFTEASQELRFSKDTVKCDTVYNQIRSETYTFKVYNEENKDIIIPKIALEQSASSLYKINVDGKAGHTFSNVPLRKNDSLYIFVEIAPQTSRPEFIAVDKVIFSLKNNVQQSVTLYSVVQDAEFFIESNTHPNILTGTHTWTKDKAKVIFGNLTLGQNAVLNIQKGTKVIFTKNSGMKLSTNAQLTTNGTYDEPVIFRGDRNDPRYDTLPKNWNAIMAENGAHLQLNHAKIFGGNTGIILKNATANLHNTLIHTFEEYGIYAENATIHASNSVFNQCKNTSIALYKGGNYSFNHCTIANYWLENNSIGQGISLYATNEVKTTSGIFEYAAMNLVIRNSIIYSSTNNAMTFKPISGQTFNYQLQHILLNHNNNAGFALTNNTNITQAIANQNPLFLNTTSGKMNMRVDAHSPAKNAGNIATAQLFPTDITGNNRTAHPTLGAYQ